MGFDFFYSQDFAVNFFSLSFLSHSVQLLQVLAAYVKSIEDHGYILHFGLPSFTGFLPKSSQAG